MSDKHDRKTALLDDMMQRVTYGELRQRIVIESERLRDGKLAVLEMGNTVDSVIFYYACLFAGIVSIIVHDNLSEFELSKYISEYAPDYLFLSRRINEKVLSDKGYVAIKKQEINVVYEKSQKTEKVMNPDLAILLPTSGTSQISKLVRISKRNLLDNTLNICRTLKIASDDVAITSLPLSYTYGLSVLNTHLMKRATVLVTGKSVVQKSFWEFAGANHATSFAGVPYTYELLEKNGHIKKKNTIKKYTQAGGRLAHSVREKFIDYCANNNKTFTIMYGQTEATARISVLPWEDIRRKRESVGKVIRGGKINIEGHPDVGKSGEIIYTGKNVCMGYCSSIEDLALGDVNKGLLYTGDYGYMDEEGFLYLTGRRDDFVKLYGRRINLNSIVRLMDELYGLEIVTQVRESDIVLLYEKENEERINQVKHVFCKEINLPEKNVIFQKVEYFQRNGNGKICKGKDNGNNI